MGLVYFSAILFEQALGTDLSQAIAPAVLNTTFVSGLTLRRHIAVPRHQSLGCYAL
jgi:hypothetical protein